jgi:hypothetical protein
MGFYRKGGVMITENWGVARGNDHWLGGVMITGKRGNDHRSF